MELLSKFPLLPLLGVNCCLNLLHISDKKNYPHNKEERIYEFAIRYMVNPTLYVNKAFKEKVQKCINYTFGTITQPFTKNVMKTNLCFSISNVL